MSLINVNDARIEVDDACTVKTLTLEILFCPEFCQGYVTFEGGGCINSIFTDFFFFCKFNRIHVTPEVPQSPDALLG